AAEIKSGRGGRPPRHARRAMLIEHAVHIGKQPAQIGTEAGRKNDRIETLLAAAGKHDAFRREAVDAAAHLDRAVANPGERPDVDQWHAAVLLDHLSWSLGGPLQSKLLDRADC